MLTTATNVVIIKVFAAIVNGNYIDQLVRQISNAKQLQDVIMSKRASKFIMRSNQSNAD
jgi:hypothetical protein